jgi:hypothetical protein
MGQSHAKYKTLEKCINFCDLALKIYLGLFMVVLLLLLAYPILVYWFTGEQVLMITLFIPGVNPFSYWGYIVHYVMHLTLALFCFMGTPIGDFYVMMDVVHIHIFAEFLNLKVREINEFLLNPSEPMTYLVFKRTLKKLLQELIVEQLYYADYIEQLANIYLVMVTLHMGTATFSLAISLFILYTVSQDGFNVNH